MIIENKRRVFRDILIALLFVLVSCTNNNIRLYFKNKSGIEFVYENNGVGFNIFSNKDSIIGSSNPLWIELYDGEKSELVYSKYNNVENKEGNIMANAIIKVDSATIIINDIWTKKDHGLEVSRKVIVEGNSQKSFMSGIGFVFENHDRDNTEYFAPGMIYGSTDNLSKSSIGGQNVYDKGEGKVWIREDRLPAPLLALRFNNGQSFSILNNNPDGKTILEDAHDISAETLIDENLRFGSLFVEQDSNVLITGYAFPGTEGEYTYKGNTYPGGQLHKWRKRYHPLKNGLTQEYTLSFNLAEYNDFQLFYSAEWQRAFELLKPEVNYQDVELVRETMLSIIPDLVIRKSGKVGLSNWYDATDPTDKLIDNKAVFGFTGKNLEMAYYLIYNSELNKDYRKLAIEIINSFLDLKVNPPAGEGYWFDNGKSALAIPHHNHIYLRSYGDGMKVLAKAYKLEKENGVKHNDWLEWMTSFAEWIITQQYEDGGFPRAWKPGIGEISEKSPASSYNIIPFLCEMYKITGDKKWIDAAVKTGEYSWESGHNTGCFVGGTIDNPDVLDKEAGTLSFEAYLELYEATKDKKWVHRAEVAAQYAETWMYLWNVPIVENDNEKEWAKGVSTVGIQLISTGHSLTDNYMAFDVDEYAKLYKYTGNKHYFDIAKILLHNTKGMLALPDKQYQYRAPGWIQEHWSLAPPRGKGLHPGWLPWVTTSNLNGICETEIFDRDLFDDLISE